jgi:predicted metal-binding protein
MTEPNLSLQRFLHAASELCFCAFFEKENYFESCIVVIEFPKCGTSLDG